MMSQNQQIPSQFKARIRSQIDDAEKFFQVLEGKSPTTVRLNPRKLKIAEAVLSGQALPWNDTGLLLNQRPKFKNDPNFHAGLYYPMEASSMFLDWVLRQINIAQNGIILDLCAAPGGKSLILKDRFPDNTLVSNEIDRKRVHVLKENALRWGTENHIVINSEASRLNETALKFDLVVVDAPCSGEGLFRKDKASRLEWTSEKAHGCALRQNTILNETVDLLQPGGYLIYSTCTYNEEENIAQVERLVGEFGFESVDIDLPTDVNIEKLQKDAVLGYQFWPHRTTGEGFFISVLRNSSEGDYVSLGGNDKIKSRQLSEFSEFKSEGMIIEKFDNKIYAFHEDEWRVFKQVSAAGKVIKKGIYLGELKGKDFIPSYDYAMNIRSFNYSSKLDLNTEQARLYLQGHSIQSTSDRGPVLLTCNGMSLGFGKSNGSRINNLYPKHLRIN